MTDERDPAIDRRYRELGAEEPPRALDDAIRAAARRPARGWTSRWAVPLSLAAVLVLSVTVTLNVEREAPEIATAQAPAPVPERKAPAEAADAPTATERPREALKPEKARRKPFITDPPVVAEAAPPKAEAPPPAAGAALGAPRQEAREDRPVEQARAAPLSKRMQVQETPEQELERIALLRKEGRHEEADKALADFRKRLPDYKITDSMLERVEKR